MKLRLFSLMLLCFVFSSCHPTQEEAYSPTPYELPQPLFFPTTNNIPEDNPMTEEGVALGKQLFFEEHSCALCHRKEYSYEFGPEGTLEHLGTQHTMLPLINLAWNTTGLGWKSQVTTLEDMVYAAYTDPTEIDADTAQVVLHLQQSDLYPALFKKAFGTDKINFVLNIFSRAILHLSMLNDTDINQITPPNKLVVNHILHNMIDFQLPEIQP